MRWMPTSGASTSMIVPWAAATVAPADRLAEHEGGPADRGDQHLAQEAELAVPDDREGGEHRRHDHAHGHDAGVDELAEVESAGRPDQAAHAVAEDEEEQDGLDRARSGSEYGCARSG